MTSALALALLASTLSVAPNAVGSDAIERAVLKRSPAGVFRVMLVSHTDRVAPGCAVDQLEVFGKVLGSGRVTLKLGGSLPDGRACSGWGFAEVRLYTKVLVVREKRVRGEHVADAVASEDRELTLGRSYVQGLSADAVAADTLDPGLALEARHVQNAGQIPGRPLDVELRLGELVLEARGNAVPCTPDLVCAVLPSGKRVSGHWIDGHLEVVLP